MSTSAKGLLDICIDSSFVARQLCGVDTHGGGRLVADSLGGFLDPKLCHWGSCRSPRCHISFDMGMKKGR